MKLLKFGLALTALVFIIIPLIAVIVIFLIALFS